VDPLVEAVRRQSEKVNEVFTKTSESLERRLALIGHTWSSTNAECLEKHFGPIQKVSYGNIAKAGEHTITFIQLVREAVDVVQCHRIVSEEFSFQIDSLSHRLETLVDQAEAWSQPRKTFNNRVEDIATVQQRPVKGKFVACYLCGQNHYVKHCLWKTTTLE